MRQLKVLVLFFGFWATMATSASIEVCVIPLRDVVVIPEARMIVGTLQHMFMRNSEGVGLNFEPVDPMGFLDSESKIGVRNYAGATCKAVFTTDDEKEFQTKWQEVVEAHNNKARTTRYQLGNTNCQQVTRAILSELGYSLPKEIGDILSQQQAGTIM